MMWNILFLTHWESFSEDLNIKIKHYSSKKVKTSNRILMLVSRSNLNCKLGMTIAVETKGQRASKQ